MSLGGKIGVLGKIYNFLLNKSSETLSFEAKMLSFEPKKLSFQQKSALSFLQLEFLQFCSKKEPAVA